ncbi:MAG: alanine--tRNA ligase [Vampirovibrio sp.]|nr:alanine--tRNA ligase [Vampirovibrio sp.]
MAESAAATTSAMSGAEIRNAFIQFFKEKASTPHLHKPSASLVPDNPTVLLTPAGMLPFVPIFLGIKPPPSPPRVVSVQKCARVSGKASDLENVGRTAFHHTFFEMLGNFSFGDYFKAEIIPWSWEFVTQILKLPPEKLYVSVYETDMEARDIWRDTVGVSEERIWFRDEKDNFWGPPGPTGPCGPCSEIYVDRGESFTDPEERYLEIWNLVFMELFQDADGNRTPLEKKNVDTGMGLERIAMVLQNAGNTFETDLLMPLVEAVGKLAGKDYGKSPQTDTALKIVADHLRFVCFCLADGVTPSNEGRGYVVRMILRRAVRYGKKDLGLNEPFLYRLASSVQKCYQEAYPELNEKFKQTVENIQAEEVRFFETLERGSKLVDEVLADLKKAGKNVVPGEDVFKLYDTYGFPVELTADIFKEQGMTLDEAGFEACMDTQRQTARKAHKGESIVDDQVYAEILKQVGPTQFVGYETLVTQATVKALIVDGKPVDEVGGTNQAFEAVLDTTPFYAESGGQVGDRGSFSREDGPHGLTVVVNDTMKVGELFIHKCLFDNGKVLRVGETLKAQVEPLTRQLAAIHHSATHLLNAALKKVLGDQVSQAGSYVSPEGARFDFTLNRGVTPNELQRIELMVNQWILENVPREALVMDIEAAKASGAVAMFGEKYGDEVRVVTYGNMSKELCGGTHVDALGQIGLIKITSESAIAAGIRRIEMVAGEKAYRLFKQSESELSRIAGLMKSPLKETPEKVEKLVEENKAKDKAIKALQEKLAAQEVDGVVAKLAESNAEAPVLFHQMNQTADGLKYIAEQVGQKAGSHVLLLAADVEGKAVFVASVSKNFVAQKISAGDIVKKVASICGGGGGGKPNFAQAGGKDASKIAEALQTVQADILDQIKTLTKA